MMNIISKIIVVPRLPEKLFHLRDLAYNLWWTWDYEAIALFNRLDRDLWEKSNHNPVLMLGTISQERLEGLAADDSFVEHLQRVWDKFKRYLESPRRYTGEEYKDWSIAYFSAEFGITECLGIYAGGLGVLAGDHVKSASDLGLPLFGVGILYREGYFRQYLNPDGWQQEIYPEHDFYNLPVHLQMDNDGRPVAVDVPYPGRTVKAQVWRIDVGRVPLYMLDTNIEANSKDDRDISAQLYGGDDEMKIQQHILLGIGGLRALNKLGIVPRVCHMNEPHSAYLALERIRQIMQKYNCSFKEAREVAIAGTVFTTHTPIPAGNERFSFSLIDKYFSDYWKEVGISRDDFLALGKETPSSKDFCQTVLALKLSTIRNGVSALHADVSRKMWMGVWPEVPRQEIPIQNITNGIHTRSWISNDLAGLYDRYLGSRWVLRPSEPDIWAKVDTIPDGELWRTHERRRERLVAFARARLKTQLEQRGAPPSEIGLADEVLDPEALTIGFARRFATYKRGTLILRDIERLSRLISDRERPIQIIFAGKAHPRDADAKELIRTIIHTERRPELRRRMVFIEDYDINVARYMVQGCDVWLSTPLKPQEASGTSGMKAGANGCLNVSIPDGWWAEGYEQGNGWTIGKGESYPSREEQDTVESNALYNLLEKEIIPMFYERGHDGLPRKWIAYMKNCIRTVGPRFGTNRMLMDYCEQCYLPSFERWRFLHDNDLARAKELTSWKEMLYKNWSQIKVRNIETSCLKEIQVGRDMEIRAFIDLGSTIKPRDVRVEAVYGPIDALGSIATHKVLPLAFKNTTDDGLHLFAGSVSFRTTGQQALALRITPDQYKVPSSFDMGLILWAEPSVFMCRLKQ